MTSHRTGPRLPGAQPPSRDERRREILTGTAAALGIAALVLGVPVALLTLVGSPLPTTMPSRGWLTADISFGTVLAVISVAVWLAWAHFVVCLVVEWRAGRRGAGVPRSILFAGGSQVLARRLVGAVLLLAGAATLAPSGAFAGPAETRPAVVASVSAQGVLQQAAQVGDELEHAAAGAAAQSAAGAGAVDAAHKYYEVSPPEGRHHDCLWDIAERFLGDPLRYREIYAMNRDRPQPDGRSLTDADLIRPGWILQLPADAKGAELRAADPLVPAPATGAATTATETETGAAVQRGASVAQHVAAGDSDQGAGRTALGGGLLAAGLLALVTARRGPFGRGPRDSVAERRLRLAANPGKAQFLDTALRGLAYAREQQGLPMPEAYVAFLRDDQLLVHFSPAPEGEPPTPWIAREDGRSWLVDADAVLPPPAGVLAPYPAMVNLGIAHGWEVLVDLEFAPGIVSLGGDPEVGRDVAASAAVELATNLWSDDVDVTLVGFGDDLAAVAPERLRRADALADVLAAAEAERPRTGAVLRSLGVNGVLQGRAARPDRAALRPHVLVLSGPPAPEEAARLAALTGPGRSPFAVLCVGDTLGARWRFTVTHAGRLDLGVLGFDTEAHRLGVDDYRGVAELVRSADRTRDDLAARIRALTPGSALASLLDPAEDDDRDPPPLAPALPAELLDPALPAPVEVRLLGPVAVSAPGPVAPDRLPVLTEMVLAAALYPEGLHDAVLRASVWPRGVEDDVVDAAIRDVQVWLGTGTGGTPRFARGDDGRWRLGRDIRCDWHVLCGLVAGADDAGERGRLYAGLGLVRGEGFSAAPTGRYAWLAFHRAARDARVVGTAAARRLAVLALAQNDLRQAEWALRQGLALAPAAEVLWRDLLRLLGGDDPHTAGLIADELYGTLARHGVPGGAEPETDALVQQLAPGRRVTTA
jgi:hypothetical protein